MSCRSVYIERIKNCNRKREKNAEIKHSNVPLRTHVLKNFRIFVINIEMFIYRAI